LSSWVSVRAYQHSMSAHLVTALRAIVNPGGTLDNSGRAPRNWKTLPVKSVQHKATVPVRQDMTRVVWCVSPVDRVCTPVCPARVRVCTPLCPAHVPLVSSSCPLRFVRVHAVVRTPLCMRARLSHFGVRTKAAHTIWKAVVFVVRELHLQIKQSDSPCPRQF